jgi:hypothetical protein
VLQKECVACSCHRDPVTEQLSINGLPFSLNRDAPGLNMALQSQRTYLPAAVRMRLTRLGGVPKKRFGWQNAKTIAVAIGHRKDDDPLRTVRDVADTLQSPNFEAAVSLVREKMQVAVAWHSKFRN